MSATTRFSLSDSGVGASDTSRTSSKRRRDDDPAHIAGPPLNKPKRTPADVRVQCAGYAHHLFNRGGVRTHVIGGLVTNASLELLLYTRSGGCSTKPFDFVDNPTLFLRILLSFSRLTFTQWGFFDSLIPCTLSTTEYPVDSRERDPWMFQGRTLNIGEQRYKVSDVRVFPRGLIGRGTWTMGTKAMSGEKADGSEVEGLVLKISSAATTRQAEKFIIQKARTTAKSHTDHEWVLSHLPDVRDSGDFEPSVSFEQLFGEGYEKRTLRYMVAEELFPITDLTDPEELRLAFKDIIMCEPLSLSLYSPRTDSD